jgi:hypothetical protein
MGVWVPWRLGNPGDQRRQRKGFLTAKEAEARARKAHRKAEFARKKRAAAAARRAKAKTKARGR